MKYKIIFDNGKPYEETAENKTDLKAKLKKFYEEQDKEDYFNAYVYNDKDEDITETQFIDEIINEILNII